MAHSAGGGPPAPGFVAYKQRALRRAVPLSAHLEITYACNWRCVFCYNPRHHDLRRLTLGEWEAVLDDLRRLGTLTVTLTGGEPLAHPQFFELAAAVRQRAFLLRVFTNGTLVDDEAAGRLAELKPMAVELSLHGATAEIHDAATARRGSFGELWTAVERLTARGVSVKLKTPLTRLNEHQLEAMVGLVAARGLGHSIDPTLTPNDNGDRGPLAFSPSPAAVERLMLVLRERGRLPGTQREEGGSNCGLGRLTLAVDPEGNVFPCLQWRRTSLGNVRAQRLADLWPASAEREQAAAVSRAANERLIGLGGALAAFPFCPALAEQATGDPLGVSDEHRRQAEAAARSRG